MKLHERCHVTDEHILYYDKEDDVYYCFEQKDIDDLLDTFTNPYTGRRLTADFIDQVELLKRSGLKITSHLDEDIEKFVESQQFKRKYGVMVLKVLDMAGQNLMDWSTWLQSPDGIRYLKDLSSDAKKSLGFIFALGVENGLIKHSFLRAMGLNLDSNWMKTLGSYVSIDGIDKSVTSLMARMSYDTNVINKVHEMIGDGFASLTSLFRKGSRKNEINSARQSKIGRLIKKQLQERR